MNIKINDLITELPDNTTILEALKIRKIEPQGIAVAVNGTVVPKGEYETKKLSDGDTLLIIKAFYGG